MAITVKHKFVSAIPDSGDTSIVQPSNWNDSHELTGTVPVDNGGTGASTLTGYVKGNGTSAMTAASTIPNTDITGLGTASTKDAGVANGVATLDSGGKVPISELPAAVLGALSYQGTWDASTNTPTLTSSVGTKGYYYVVSVAGSTNLNGITDWQVGDWAVFNGSVWQKVDNTDAGGDVVGPASATDNAIARFDSTTGKLIQNSVVTIDDVGNESGILTQQFSNGTLVSVAAGKMWYNGSLGSWNLGMGGGNITQQVGEELFIYGKASAAITDSPLQIIYHTGVVGASGVIEFAPTVAGITDENAIIGVATESIALNGFGRITSFGVVHGINTTGSAFGETWANDDVIWYNPVTGNPTNVKPSAPNIKFQIGLVINAGSGGSGSFQVLLQAGTQLGGTDSNVQLTTPTAAQLLTYSTSSGYWKNTSLTAGTGISVSAASSGVLTVTNSLPDQTVVMNSGTGISVTGTYPNFTVTNTSPSSGGTVTSITAGTGLTGGTITSSGTIAIDSTVATLTGSQILTNKTISGATNTLTNIGNSSLTNSSITINGSAVSLGGSVSVGTVTSVTGTAPVVSSGGATPAISMAQATGSVSGYLSSTDWTTFNNKGSGTVTAVSVASANGFAGTSSGGATPALTLTTSISGVLKGSSSALAAATAGTDFVAPATATNFTAQQYFGNVALTDGATISWAANTAQVATFTFVSSNRTMGAPTGLVSGAYYGLAVIQNGGSNTLTWNSVFKWTGGTAPTLSTAAGAKDYFVFRSDGTNLYEQGRSLGVA